MPTDPDTTTIRVPKRLVDALRPIARAHQRSVSAEVRVAIAAYIDAHQTDQ